MINDLLKGKYIKNKKLITLYVIEPLQMSKYKTGLNNLLEIKVNIIMWSIYLNP